MMRRRYQRQKPKLSASEINRWNEVARRVQRGEFDQRSVPQSNPTEKPDRISGEWVWVKNNSDRDFQQYDVGSLGDWDGTDSTDVVFDLAVENLWRPNVVALEGIPRGEIGRVQISGVTKAKFHTPLLMFQLNEPQYCFLDPAENSLTIDSLNTQLTGGSSRVLHALNNTRFACVQLNVDVPAVTVLDWYPSNASGQELFDSTISNAGSKLDGSLPRYGGVTVLTHPSNSNWHTFRLARPGFYRITVNTRMPGGVIQDYQIEPKLEVVSGAANWDTNIHGRSYAEQLATTDLIPAWSRHDHVANHYLRVTENTILFLRAIANSNTLNTQTSGEANNFIAIELLCPAQPAVDSGDHFDQFKWQYNQQAL